MASHPLPHEKLVEITRQMQRYVPKDYRGAAIPVLDNLLNGQPPKHLEISEIGDHIVMRLSHSRIIDEMIICLCGLEVQWMVKTNPDKHFILSFVNVEFMSSAYLGQMINADRFAKANGSKLKLTSVCPEIYEVFTITKLDQLFTITDSEAAAMC